MKGLTVFISSTYEDLKHVRERLFWAILKHGCYPSGMELFGAVAASSWDYIQRVIDRADLVVLVIGHRYGSLLTDGRSYTEHEFDYAIANGKPVLCFWRKLDPSNPETAERTAFRKKCQHYQGGEWETEQELETLVGQSLTSHLIGNTMEAGPGLEMGTPHLRQMVQRQDCPGVKSLFCRNVHMPASGRQTALTWTEFGAGLAALLDLLRNHSVHLANPLLVGINQSGIGIAGMLLENLMPSSKLGYLRMEAGEAKIDFLPKVTGPVLVLLVDFEIKTGRSILKLADALRSRIPNCDLQLACLGAQAQRIGTNRQLHFSNLDCSENVHRAGLRRVFFTLIAEDPSIAPPE
jgi:hypothetical protein